MKRLERIFPFVPAVGLAGIIIGSSLLLPLPKENTIKYSHLGFCFPPTYIVDTNGDGESDETRTLLIGNRRPVMTYGKPTQEQKEFYRNQKTM